MNDLSKEERLEQLILKKAEKYGENKWLRIKRTFFIICGALYLIELYFVLMYGISEIDIEAILGFLFIPPFVAGFIMFISLGVWSYVLDKTVKERIEIAKLEGRLEEIKFGKYE